VTDELAVPSHADLVADLSLVREHGLVRLRWLHLVALAAAARLCDFTSSPDPEPAAIEALLRAAVERLGGGRLGEAASYTFGLVQGTKDWPAQDRRTEVARIYGVTPERARKAQEKTVIEQTAEEILVLLHERRLRAARLQLEHRGPADSRLAVAWVERFEAYYRIWTPVTHLAGDLRAAYETRREADPGHAPWDPSQPWDGPEGQARNYARYALFAHTWFLLELKKFLVARGGLWLLSSQDIETRTSDAVYRIGLYSPLTEEDDSWLRQALSQAPGQEQLVFAQALEASSRGSAIHAKWQKHVAACACPTDDQLEPTCRVHLTISACDDYCRFIDEDWDRIADWYHPTDRRPPRVKADEVYRRLVEGRPKTTR
jgi:hypothetical protein